MSHALNIVVLEEQGLSRDVLVKALQSWGHACSVIENKGSAWAIIKSAPAPCVVVADWHADFLDCEELVRRIRRKVSLRKVYILAAVPRGAVGAIRRSMQCGANDIILRPYDLDEVQLRLHMASRLMGLKVDELVFD